jgi:serine/threonine-protein kinase
LAGLLLLTVLLGLLAFGGAAAFLALAPIFMKTVTPAATPAPTNAPAATSTPALGIGSTQTGVDGMTLLYVPAGLFTMGTDGGNANEKPAHTVTLDAFWIDRTEVTNGMYAQCVRAGKCQAPQALSSVTHADYYANALYADYPVIHVDWNQASAYCEWAGRRLPTEAEWEKAARGTDGRTYPWSDKEPNRSLANYATPDTTQVGKYLAGASPYGALDMAGNVWEWTAGWYDVYPGGNKAASPDFGEKYRVLRGGAWSLVGSSLRSANRLRYDPATSGVSIGFRCLLSQ